VLDERATEVYEQLTQGVSAADAGMIADDFASTVKRSEDGPDLSTTHAVAPDHEPAQLPLDGRRQ
jgi:hypothetical protein